MNSAAVLSRLAAGEFDMQYVTPEFKDGGSLYRIGYEIKGGVITRSKLSGDTVLETTVYETDEDKLGFILAHPYFFPYDKDFR